MVVLNIKLTLQFNFLLAILIAQVSGFFPRQSLSINPRGKYTIKSTQSLSIFGQKNTRLHNLKMAKQNLTRRTPENVSLEIKDPVDPTALDQANAILEEIRDDDSGFVIPSKLIEVAKRLGDISKDATSFIITKDQCKAAYDELPEDDRKSLESIYNRVKIFAEAQRASIVDVEIPIPGGKAGHTVRPCKGMQKFTAIETIMVFEWCDHKFISKTDNGY